MGYTHYWGITETPIPAGALEKTVADAKRIVEAAKIPLVGTMGDPTTSAVLDPNDCIAFNGVAGDSHESFMFEPHNEDWACCKTAHKPYDVVVTSILARAQFHYGAALKVTTDGDIGEWSAAFDLCVDLFAQEPDVAFYEPRISTT